MKLCIQLHLARLLLSNIVFIFEILGINQTQLPVHDWVHKAELQPEAGRNPDHVAVDKAVIRFNDEQYWLYAAVGPENKRITLYNA